MSRTRRANSDMDGLPYAKLISTNSLKQNSDKTIDTRHVTVYEPRAIHAKRESLHQTVKKNDTQELIADTYRLLKYYFQNQDEDFFLKVKKYLKSEWESHKKVFNEHINKLSYLEKEMQKKNYNQIELEIVIEWRKNPVLYCIRAFWYELILAQNFDSLSKFVEKYCNFKQFVAQLAYLFFENFFARVFKEERQKLLDKLTERTSHLIITHTSTWCKISDKLVIPLIKNSSKSFKESQYEDCKIDLESLELKTVALDLNSKEPQLVKTTDSLEKFLMEYKILEKIKHLIDIKKNMEMQIKKRFDIEIAEGRMTKPKLLEVDDYLDCLVYCIIKADISVQNLGLSLKYLNAILGEDKQVVLSKFKCEAYLTDLQATYQFFKSKLVEKKEKDLEQISVQL